MDKLTTKQKLFVDEYLINANATQAAIKAGYSEKSAQVIGQENLTKPLVKKYIEEMLEKIQSEKIADATEVMIYLSSVLRDEQTEQVVITEGTGDGCSEARIIEKKLAGREKIKAAELLAKRYGILTDKVDWQGNVVIFKGEDQLED